MFFNTTASTPLIRHWSTGARCARLLRTNACFVRNYLLTMDTHSISKTFRVIFKFITEKNTSMWGWSGRGKGQQPSLASQAYAPDCSQASGRLAPQQPTALTHLLLNSFKDTFDRNIKPLLLMVLFNISHQLFIGILLDFPRPIKNI